MKETAVQVNERKKRNGLRKQREAHEREQQKVWDRLKDTGEPKIRTLKDDWTFEDAADIETMHGLDVEQEMIDSLTASICNGGWEDE